MQNKFKLLLASILLIAGCTLVSVGGHGRSPHLPENNAEYAHTAVMIVSESMRSGGTGVILDSHPGASHILTNMHICQLIQVGGIVITDNGLRYPVDAFRLYKRHDLCLIDVYADLNINVKFADKAPSDYDPSIVVGHPALLPTIVTFGHFSQHKQITLVVDMQKCDGSEKDDEALECIFTGGKPVTRNLQAQATSSLIMPGSSGSGVYNVKGELTALVFAGNQGLGYGFLVPWEYLNHFLKHKDNYPVQTPNPKKDPENFFTSYFKFEKLCTNEVVIHVPEICHSIANLGVYHY